MLVAKLRATTNGKPDHTYVMGSDGTCIAKDLKTLRGLRNRLTHGAWRRGTWDVWHVNQERFYAEWGAPVETFVID